MAVQCGDSVGLSASPMTHLYCLSLKSKFNVGIQKLKIEIMGEILTLFWQLSSSEVSVVGVYI